jgi:hypothetical protein
MSRFELTYFINISFMIYFSLDLGQNIRLKIMYSCIGDNPEA